MKALPLLLPALAVCLAPGSGHADTQQDEIRALEARIAQLEQASPPPVAPADNWEDRLKINGFMSAGFGYANADGFLYDGGLTESYITHKTDSIVGLQVEAAVNKQASAVLQLVARGAEDFALEAEWAYISFRPGDQDEIRVGHMRTPLFMMSEYLEVGYTYPWTRPPIESYLEIAPSSYDGMTWRHRSNTGDWQHEFQLSWGTSGENKNGNNLLTTNDWTLGFTSSTGNWQIGGQIIRGDLALENPLLTALTQLPGSPVQPVEDDQFIYTSLGLQYDNGSLLAMTEVIEGTFDGLFPDTLAGYATVGYRFGKVMPHITWSSSSIQDKGDRPLLPALEFQDDHLPINDGIPDLCPLLNPNPNAALCLAIKPNFDPMVPAATIGIPLPADTLERVLENAQDSVTLGVRYDFASNAAIKFDWTRVLDTHGTFGNFSAPDGNLFWDLSSGTPSPLARPRDDIDVFRVVIDVVF